MRGAGFDEVEIMEETSFPIECMASGPAAKVIINKVGLPAEEIQDTASSVARITVTQRKPLPV